ncbi:MAG: SPOR domain-containing protein, partial [Bacteroidales bacterium]|nr:SPOR domain-containing protein [Bacteroidales bacterium]
NLIVEAETPADKEGGYYLIVASFSDVDQARQVAEKYKNDFNAEMIVLPQTQQGYYRVSYGRYSTPEEAGATLPAVREKVNSDAWIYKMN